MLSGKLHEYSYLVQSASDPSLLLLPSHQDLLRQASSSLGQNNRESNEGLQILEQHVALTKIKNNAADNDAQFIYMQCSGTVFWLSCYFFYHRLAKNVTVTFYCTSSSLFYQVLVYLIAAGCYTLHYTPTSVLAMFPKKNTTRLAITQPNIIIKNTEVSFPWAHFLHGTQWHY